MDKNKTKKEGFKEFLKGNPTRLEIFIYAVALASGAFVGKYLIPLLCLK